MKFDQMQYGEIYDFDALVLDIKVRYTAQNTIYYAVTLTDGTYNFDARIWDKNIGEKLEVSKVYYFKAKLNEYGGKPQFVVNGCAASTLTSEEQQSFFKQAPLNIEEIKNEYFEYLEKIDNEILKKVVKEVISTHEEKFFSYPAAVSMHHAYRFGLAYHTISMARLAAAVIKNYPAINKDLLYAGILVHDIGKTVEFTGIDNPQYSLDGSLLGHIVIGLNIVSEAATLLNLQDTEEVKMLLHLVASHHGELEYGSPKTPQTMEAWALHLIDLTDSKLAGMNQEMELTKPGSFSQKIATVNKQLYKPNIK